MRILTNIYEDKHVAGGPQRYAPSFVRAMQERGHHVVGFFLKGLLGSTYKAAVSAAVGDARPGMPEALEEARAALAPLVRDARGDVLVLHGFSLANWLLFDAARSQGVPCVVARHGFWYKEIGSALPPAVIRRMEEMERESLAGAACNVFLNAWSVGKMEERHPGILGDRTAVIPLPYDPAFADPAPVSATANRIGFVARWDPIKNIPLVRAFAEAYPSYDVVALTRVGGRRPLEQEEEPFARAVRVLPPVEPSELRSFYASCAALILPSHFDVNPTVVMEAALQGRATVITDGVGWADLYRAHGMDALITEPNADALAAAVKEAVARPLPASFVNDIRERCAPDHVFDAWHDLIQTV